MTVSKKTWRSLALFCLFLVPGVLLADEPQLPRKDRVCLVEMFNLAEAVQDSIWVGWSNAPFALLLVTESYEYLVRHPNATHNFDTLGYDPGLRSKILFRKRLFAKNLLAAMPAINGLSTIVVGQRDQTGRPDPANWILTILHEHFHQFQQSQPGYYAATEALGLSHGDQSGMWMLNYPFPYDSTNVNRLFSESCQALHEALTASTEMLPGAVRNYLAARTHFQNVLSAEDYSYFSFQLWQEGIARYTEYRVAATAATTLRPTDKFPSFKKSSFSTIADSIRSGILSQLTVLSLTKLHRAAFYTYGAAEAMLLDKVNPDWQRDYMNRKFFLEKYFRKLE